MPTVNLNKRTVLKQLGKKVSDEELKDRIPMLGTDLSDVTNDEIIVEIFPDRPDMLSEEGFARALAGFLGIEKGLKKYAIKEGDYKASVDPSVKKVREKVTAAVVKGVKVDDAFIAGMMQMQEKLHATHSRNRKKASIGMYDLDTIKFPIKYTTVDENFKFIPLEFTKEITVRQILEEHPKGRDYRHLLKGDRYPIWLDADGEVLSLPPIINSAHTAITEKTKNIFIDVTGLDADTVEAALNMLVTTLADQGAEIYPVDISGRQTPDLAPRKMMLDVAYANKWIGLDLTPNQMSALLQKMRYGVNIKTNGLEVLIPAYRPDVLHPVDLAEDVAIAYGFDNLEEFIPNVSTIGMESNETIFLRKAAEVCVGLGLLECCSYHLTSEDVLVKKMNRERAGTVKTTNSINQNYDTVRDYLLPGLMKVLSENTHYEYPQKLFEIGRIVKKYGKEVKEMDSLAIVSAHKNADFAEIKGMAEAFFRSIGEEVSFKKVNHESFIPGRCAAVMIKGKRIGALGEIHPQVLNNFSLEEPAAGMEVVLEGLIQN